MSKPPEETLATLRDAAWPPSRIGEALTLFALRLGLQRPEEGVVPPQEVSEEQFPTWLEAAATRTGVQADQVFVALDELDSLLTHGAPLLVRIACLDGAPLLAIAGSMRGRVMAMAPDGRVHRLKTSTILAAILAPFETPVEAAVDDVVGRMALPRRRRARARARMISDRLRMTRFRGCWLMRLPPGSPLVLEANESRVPRRVTALVAAYAAQYILFVCSWWLLGRAVLDGTVNRGWLLGWLLLLGSLVPLRLAVTWTQGVLTVSIGAWLRRRLLRGAFSIDRQEIRRKGIGQLFALVVEAAAVDAMALSGGLSAAFAVIELLVASVVLWLGASPLPVPALAAWVALTSCASWRYFRRRELWTGQRLAMTDELLEAMVGHRTRLVQQSANDHHQREDQSLDRYLSLGQRMDNAGLWLTALIPRGWLVLALVVLVPTLARGESAARVAVSLGGVLLAYRALQRLAAGATNLTGAVVASRAIVSLARAASTREPLPLSSAILRTATTAAGGRENVVLQARDLVFRYRRQGEPVISGASLTVERHSRFLLEGASGSGKTTLGAMLAGLEQPESGLLLAGGLDRASLGAAGWRKRVVMAPQPHDNYVVGGSLAFNLLMGRRWPAEGSDLADAEAVCRDLGLGDLLDRLPGGLHQVIGETGWQLSQGERVRVFLARALLQQPDLLVLDESFSALDPENVDRALRSVANSGSAVLAISHP